MPRDFVESVMAVRSLESIISQSLCIEWFHPMDHGKIVHVISWDCSGLVADGKVGLVVY